METREMKGILLRQAAIFHSYPQTAINAKRYVCNPVLRSPSRVAPGLLLVWMDSFLLRLWFELFEFASLMRRRFVAFLGLVLPAGIAISYMRRSGLQFWVKTRIRTLRYCNDALVITLRLPKWMVLFESIPYIYYVSTMMAAFLEFVKCGKKTVFMIETT